MRPQGFLGARWWGSLGGVGPDADGRSVPWTRRPPQPASRTLHVLPKPSTFLTPPAHAPTKSPGAPIARSIVAVRAAHIAGSGPRGVGRRRAGGGVMGAPQIVDGPPSQTTGRERILPVMRYLEAANGSGSANRMPVPERSSVLYIAPGVERSVRGMVREKRLAMRPGRTAGSTAGTPLRSSPG